MTKSEFRNGKSTKDTKVNTKAHEEEGFSPSCAFVFTFVSFVVSALGFGHSDLGFDSGFGDSEFGFLT
jgi:hypothetical protein